MGRSPDVGEKKAENSLEETERVRTRTDNDISPHKRRKKKKKETVSKSDFLEEKKKTTSMGGAKPEKHTWNAKRRGEGAEARVALLFEDEQSK